VSIRNSIRTRRPGPWAIHPGHKGKEDLWSCRLALAHWSRDGQYTDTDFEVFFIHVEFSVARNIPELIGIRNYVIRKLLMVMKTQFMQQNNEKETKPMCRYPWINVPWSWLTGSFWKSFVKFFVILSIF